MSGARKTALVAAGLFLFNVAINAPLFLPGEHKYRESIEGGYASMAKFISEHPNPFGWNPLQYKGLPTHNWYLPVLPYVSAFAIKLLPFLRAEHVYRLIVVTIVCFGPVSMFLFALEFTRSRRWSFIASLLYMFLSASYVLFPAVTSDQGFTYVPWRIQVLVKYGEGPHNVGLVLIPLALIACWRAAIGRRFSQLALAAAALALVTLTNWVAGVALGWCCLMMLLSGPASSPETGFLGQRILLSALLGYLIACFWLTPEYIATAFLNWPADAVGYTPDTSKYQLLAILFAVPAAIAAIFLWWPRRFYLCFLLTCLSGFAWVVGLHYWFRVDVIPESRRYALEFEFFFFATIVEIFRILLTGGHRVLRDLAFIATGFAVPYFYLLHPWNYLTQTWVQLRPAPRFGTIEYQVSGRLAALKPQGRVFVCGGTRFRLNSWFSLPQLDGTFQTGLRNRGSIYLADHIQKGSERPLGDRAGDALNMLRAGGVEYAAIHFPGSREHWRDIREPDLVVSKLELVWREGEDGIYRVPFNGLANFILPAEIPFTIPVSKAAGSLEPYVKAMDAQDRPHVEAAWQDNNQMELRAPDVREGFLVTVRVSYDPGWSATQDGQSIPVKSDPTGNLLLEPHVTASPTVLRLSYRASLQQITNSLVSLAAVVGCIAAVRRERRRLAGS